MIKTRLFQDTQISEIRLGTWQLGSADWGSVSSDRALEILETYASQEGNFLDTADIYGPGTSEKVIGEFLRHSDRVIHVATKQGQRSDGNYGHPQNFELDNMRKFVEDSLNNLGLDQLFLEQLHCIPFEVLKKLRVFDHLRQLQQEGLIRHWGVSVETVEEALFCLDQEGLASLQVIFNIFRQHVADELFDKAREKGVAIIVRVPLASGLLSGKFSQETRFDPKDHRNYNAEGQAFNAGETFSGIPFREGVELAREVGNLLPEGPMPAWALRWILDHDITTIIPGASRVDQVHTNTLASGLDPLTDQVHQELKQLYQQRIQPLIRGRI